MGVPRDTMFVAITRSAEGAGPDGGDYEDWYVEDRGDCVEVKSLIDDSLKCSIPKEPLLAALRRGPKRG